MPFILNWYFFHFYFFFLFSSVLAFFLTVYGFEYLIWHWWMTALGSFWNFKPFVNLLAKNYESSTVFGFILFSLRFFFCLSIKQRKYILEIVFIWKFWLLLLLFVFAFVAYEYIHILLQEARLVCKAKERINTMQQKFLYTYTHRHIYIFTHTFTHNYLENPFQ